MLIYLEAEAAGRAVPDFAVHLLGDLLRAADALGCRSLQVCHTVLAPLYALKLQQLAWEMCSTLSHEQPLHTSFWCFSGAVLMSAQVQWSVCL